MARQAVGLGAKREGSRLVRETCRVRCFVVCFELVLLIDGGLELMFEVKERLNHETQDNLETERWMRGLRLWIEA